MPTSSRKDLLAILISIVKRDYERISSSSMQNYLNLLCEGRSEYDSKWPGKVRCYRNGQNGFVACERSEIEYQDLGRWLMGSQVDTVFTQTGCLVSHEIKKKIRDFVDNTMITLRFVSKSIGVVDGSLNARYGYDVRAEVSELMG